MYINLLGQSNFLNINTRAIKVFGLQAAAYLTAIIDYLSIEADKAKKEQASAVQADGSFVLNRLLIQEKTSLSLEDQYGLDAGISNTGIIRVHPDNADRLFCNIQTYISVITSENPDELVKVSDALKATRGTAKETKKNYMAAAVKNSIVEADFEILEKLKSWVDSMYESKGGVNKQAVKVFQDTLNAYTQDKVIKIKILDIAIMRAYRDASWAIEVYKKSLTPSYNNKVIKQPATRIGGEQKIGVAVKNDISF